MARLERLRVYPVKGFDGVDVETARIRAGGTLAHDREFALFDGGGEVINGKRTARVHELATDFAPESRRFTVESPDGERRTFDLEQDRSRAEEWFTDYFDMDLTLRRSRDRGFVDRPDLGPSVISTATLETVASWFEDMTVADARRRVRANLEIAKVPAFWEDRFVGEDAPDFEIGSVRIQGAIPCGRCVVPQRDPDSGEPTPDFRERFIEKRRITFPAWADDAAFAHDYTLMIITRVPEAQRGSTLTVGEDLRIIE